MAPYEGSQAPARNILRNAQRQWLTDRNRMCRFSDKGLTDKLTRLTAAAADAVTAQCLLDLTTRRTSALTAAAVTSDARAVSSGSDSGKGAGSGPLMFAEVQPSRPDSAYMVRSTATQARGKHYFEVVVDHGQIKQPVEADLQLRLVATGDRFVATSYRIRPLDQVIHLEGGSTVTIGGGNLGALRLPKTVLGVAIDLDTRRFYRHEDGKWKGGAPDSAGGGRHPTRSSLSRRSGVVGLGRTTGGPKSTQHQFRPDAVCVRAAARLSGLSVQCAGRIERIACGVESGRDWRQHTGCGAATGEHCPHRRQRRR
jgi:hypothetical protein